MLWKRNPTLVLVVLFFSIVVFIPSSLGQTVTRTASTETICENGLCTHTIHSTPVFMQDEAGNWKTLPEVVSFEYKDGIFILDWFDGHYEIEPEITYNGIEYTISELKEFFPEMETIGYVIKNEYSYKYGYNITKIPKTLNERLDSVNFKITDTEETGMGKSVESAKSLTDNSHSLKNKIKLDYSDLLSESFTVDTTETDKLKVRNVTGLVNLYLDPTIELTTDDTENLEDTYVNSSAPTTNYGSSNPIHVRGDYVDWDPLRIYIKFNISSIPTTATITEAILRFYWSSYSPTPAVHHVYNQTWAEDVITWNEQPCGINFDDSAQCNLTYESLCLHGSGGESDNYTVTQGVQNDIDNSRLNSSYIINQTSTHRSSYTSKEGSPNPILQVTYTVPTGITDITNQTLSISKDQDSDTTYNVEIGNGGDFNLSHCNVTFGTDLSPSITYSKSDFNITTSENETVTITLSSGTAGVDNNAYIWVNCTSNSSGTGESGDEIAGSLNINAPILEGGGGGGGGSTIIINETLPVSEVTIEDWFETPSYAFESFLLTPFIGPLPLIVVIIFSATGIYGLQLIRKKHGKITGQEMALFAIIFVFGILLVNQSLERGETFTIQDTNIYTAIANWIQGAIENTASSVQQAPQLGVQFIANVFGG